MTLLFFGGGGGRGRYFRISNFVCKRKEMSMIQLNIWESHGLIIVFSYYTSPLHKGYNSKELFPAIQKHTMQKYNKFYNIKYL